MENKLKKGLILGGLLAAGAALWRFATSKKGKQLTKKIQKDIEVLTEKNK